MLVDISILLQFLVTGSIGLATVNSSTEHRKAGLVRIEQTLLLSRSDEKASLEFMTIHEQYFMLVTSGKGQAIQNQPPNIKRIMTH